VITFETEKVLGVRQFDTIMTEITSLQGPVESIDGKLMLRIPLNAGGSEFVECSRGIGQTDEEFLNVVIQPWLATMLDIRDGTIVAVDNRDGKFNIHPVK
jgi:hypothetical protein